MTIHVSSEGKLQFNGKSYPCALGKNGIRTDKSEGDNATPVGRFALRRVLYRADRLFEPETALDTQALHYNDGWCDDPSHVAYNHPVKTPFQASHELLWRDDHIYDVIVVLGHNDDPPVPNKGSAIFFHLAREGYSSTEGCIAVSLEDMLDILKQVTPGEEMEISL